MEVLENLCYGNKINKIAMERYKFSDAKLKKDYVCMGNKKIILTGIFSPFSEKNSYWNF